MVLKPRVIVGEAKRREDIGVAPPNERRKERIRVPGAPGDLSAHRTHTLTPTAAGLAERGHYKQSTHLHPHNSEVHLSVDARTTRHQANVQKLVRPLSQRSLGFLLVVGYRGHRQQHQQHTTICPFSSQFGPTEYPSRSKIRKALSCVTVAMITGSGIDLLCRSDWMGCRWCVRCGIARHHDQMSPTRALIKVFDTVLAYRPCPLGAAGFPGWFGAAGYNRHYQTTKERASTRGKQLMGYRSIAIAMFGHYNDSPASIRSSHVELVASTSVTKTAISLLSI